MKRTRAETEQAQYFRYLKRAKQKELDRQLTIHMRCMVLDLWGHLDEVEDFRSRKGQYPLDLILILLFIGLMMGENNVRNIETVLKHRYGKVKSWLGKRGAILRKIPSDTTILRALHKCDPLDIATVLAEWIERSFYVEDGKLHYAVDGKALRGATRKIRGKEHASFILNAFCANDGTIRLQIEVGNKTNEVGSMPDLFSAIDLTNVTITIDAAGTYGKIMDIITSNGGHAILPVKGNQSNLEKNLSDFIQRVEVGHPERIRSFDDIDNGKYQHGRIEDRHYILITDGVNGILKGTTFDGLAHSVGMVTRKITKVKQDEDGNRLHVEPTVEKQIYISDYGKELTAEQFANFVRGHWRGCETMHYILDIEFDEDRSTIHGCAKTNASFLRKAVLSLINNLKKISNTRYSCHDIRSTFRDTLGFEGSVISDDDVREFLSNPA